MDQHAPGNPEHRSGAGLARKFLDLLKAWWQGLTGRPTAQAPAAGQEVAAPGPRRTASTPDDAQPSQPETPEPPPPPHAREELSPVPATRGEAAAAKAASGKPEQGGVWNAMDELFPTSASPPKGPWQPEKVDWKED